jgi:hypothetical protein
MKICNFLRCSIANRLRLCEDGLVAAIVLVLLIGSAAAQSRKDTHGKDPRGRQQPPVIAKQGSFYVGGRTTSTDRMDRS